MAKSPSHKFGQIVGNLIEELIYPIFKNFCDRRNLYLDRQGKRGKARAGKMVKWEDKYGNSHNLDFVIEKGGTADTRGRPVAFIEAAWRRYTKHSRNKAQEIQGAVLPIREKYNWDAPFLGAVLAGIFTEGALQQIQSAGFEVLYFPYPTLVEAFNSIGLNVQFDEQTPDAQFARCVAQIERLTDTEKAQFKNKLRELNESRIERFFSELEDCLDRMIDTVAVIPLYGNEHVFQNYQEAVDFIERYDESSPSGDFQRYEIVVRYTNGDKVDASFSSKRKVLGFLQYIFGQ